MLVEEWANDSRLLLADAYDIRRLLRLTFQGFRVYHEMVNHIRDDVFVAESRYNNRLLVRSLMFWLQYMDRVRIEEERYRLVCSYVQRNIYRVSLRTWIRSRQVSDSVRQFEQVIAERRIVFLMNSWYQKTVPYIHPRRSVVKRVDDRLMGHFLCEWRKQRTMSHLNFLHRVQLMDRFYLKQFFTKLKKNKLRKFGKSVADSFCRRSRCNRVIHAFIKFTKNRICERDHLLDSGNRLVGYLVRKLALMSGGTIESNKSVLAKTEPIIEESLLHVVLEKWRSHVINESVSRARGNFEAISKSVRGWKGIVDEKKKLLKTVDVMLTKIPKKISKKFFSLWIYRFEKRKQFRENLSDFATRTIVSTELPVFRGWRSTARSEKRLKEISEKISKKFLGKKLLNFWIATARSHHKQTVLDEMSLIYQRKIASKRIVETLARNRIRCFRKRNLENVAEKFSNKLALNRWRIVLVTRFAWRSAFAFVQDQCDRGRLRRSMREWVRLIHLGYFWGRKIEEKREILRRKILVVFQLNAKHESDKRKAAIITRKFQQKRAIKNFSRYIENKKIFAKYLSWRVLREFFGLWVQARLRQARVDRLSSTVERGMLRIALYQFAVWNTDKREQEKSIVDKLMKKNLENIFFEWNFLGKFNQLFRLKESRKLVDEVIVRRELLGKYLRKMVADFRQIRGLRSLAIRQESRLKQMVFGIRTSSWLQSVRDSKLREVVYENKVSLFFSEWEKQTHMVKIHEIELEQKFEKFQKKFLRVIFSNWYFGVSNRQFLQMNILVGWHHAVSEINRKRTVVHEMHLRYIRTLLSDCFRFWVDRCRSRAELRDRVFSISSNYLQNQMRMIFLSFHKNVNLRKKFRIIRETVVRRCLIRLIDKWVNGTVTVISIRESMVRISSNIGPKMNLAWAMEELKENARIAKVFVDKEKYLLQSDLRRARSMVQSVFYEWAESTRKFSNERESVSWMRKRVGMDRLKNFLFCQREKSLMETLADEFLVAKETEKLTSMVGMVLSGWRDLVAYERLLSDKREILSKFKKSEILLRFLTEWKYRLEIKLYENELGENEADLANRVAFRQKTKIFNQLILLYLDQTEVAKIGVDFHRFLLERRVVSVLKRNNQVEKRGKAVRSWIQSKLMRQVFDSMFKEVYLTFKERIAYRRIRCISAFRKLAQYTQYRKDRAMMKLFGKWKREKEDQDANIDARSLSRVFGSWKEVTKEEHMHSHVEPKNGVSYRDIRSRSVTPSSVEVSRVETNNDSSYRKMRTRS